MKWFVVKLVFRIICGDGDHRPQFDGQLRLIAATSREDAIAKARLTGARETDFFYNEHQQPVQWKFIDICEIYPLAPLLDGAELYSRIEEKDDGDAYCEEVRQKAERLLEMRQPAAVAG